MAIEKDTLDQLLVGRDPKEVFNKDGLFDELKKALAERILNAELEDHLGGEPADGKPNHRNGYSKKSVLTESSKLDIRVQRDREGTFGVATKNLRPRHAAKLDPRRRSHGTIPTANAIRASFGCRRFERQ